MQEIVSKSIKKSFKNHTKITYGRFEVKFHK